MSIGYAIFYALKREYQKEIAKVGGPNLKGGSFYITQLSHLSIKWILPPQIVTYGTPYFFTVPLIFPKNVQKLYRRSNWNIICVFLWKNTKLINLGVIIIAIWYIVTYGTLLVIMVTVNLYLIFCDLLKCYKFYVLCGAYSTYTFLVRQKFPLYSPYSWFLIKETGVTFFLTVRFLVKLTKFTQKSYDVAKIHFSVDVPQGYNNFKTYKNIFSLKIEFMKAWR